MGIKFINPKETVEIISISDDAIDHTKSNVEKYLDERDISHIQFIEGSTPTLFVIGNVDSPSQIEIQQEHYITKLPTPEPHMTPEQIKSLKVTVTPVNQGMMLYKYFKAGCKVIKDGKNKIEVDDEVMKTIPSTVIQEIGSFIMQRSILSESKKK